MWTYIQKTGELLTPDGTVLATGYSGAEPDGKNNPAMQNVIDIGPIPCGHYKRGVMQATSSHGPDAIPLIPDPANEMHGRVNFFMHGDKIHAPGTASEGCIIQPKSARDTFNESNDPDLEVVSGNYVNDSNTHG